MNQSPKFIGFTLICLISGISATSIPALIWSPEKSMTGLPDVSDGKTVNTGNFLNNYLSPLLKNSVESGVVFLQDKLHVDDFTKYADVYSLDSDGGAFKNIKGMVEDLFSLELPGVDNPHRAIENLKTDFLHGKVHEVNSFDELEKLNLKSGEKFLLVVHLSPVSKELDVERTIKRNDDLVGKVCSHLQKRSIKYTAIFTGKASSNVQDEAVESFSGRHLLQDVTADPQTNGTFMNVSDVFIYMRDAYLCLRTEDDTGLDCPTNFTLVPDENTASKTTRFNNTAIVSLSWTGAKPNNKTDTYNLQFDFVTQNNSDRWIISRMNLTTSGGATNTSMTNATFRAIDLDTVIPILYSFHCSEFVISLDHIHDKNNSRFKGSYIKIKGFQFQPFNIQQNRFFNAQDCVGFFTRGTWMGLFPTFILIIILLFGSMMVLNLSTMDKYDDPKGKTIIIPQSSE